MNTDKLAELFGTLEENLKNHSFPKWDEFPDIDLYMDQVISLITKYMEVYNRAIGTEKIITPSMINNYVKLGIIPPPNKKKYSRIHLAYLIIICTLKQTLDISTIRKIIPADTDNIREIYNSFSEHQHKAAINAAENLRTLVQNMVYSDNDNAEKMNGFLMQVAASANIYKIFTENITSL